MKFKLEINCDNGAFDGNVVAEICEILNCLSERIEVCGFDDEPFTLKDTNGNTVGSAQLVDDEGSEQ